MNETSQSEWPELLYPAWRETCTTLHLWTQIVGKIRLSQTPWLNHSWHVPLYVTARGLTTSLIPYRSRPFELIFDFEEHVLEISVPSVTRQRIPLRPQAVADFHERLLGTLAELDINVTIRDLPCEIEGAIPFGIDRVHSAYDAEHVRRFWHALLQVDRVFKQFRTGFLGKASPVHFFWGSFDLAVTRFSGRRAPAFDRKVPGLATEVMREAYSHEVSSAGFWPGGGGTDYAAFYSYTYPAPADFGARDVQPDGAFFEERLGEFLLPYEVVRTASDPNAMLLDFLQSTYEAAAETGKWDRAALECARGIAGVPRES